MNNIYEIINNMSGDKILGSGKNKISSFNFAYEPETGAFIIVFPDSTKKIQKIQKNLKNSEILTYVKNLYPENNLNPFKIDIIPKQFHFNQQKTTDTLLFKEDEEERKFAFIDREFPPYGYALAGGMVDKDEDSLVANLRELKEELNAGNVNICKDFGVIADFEIRGSLITRFIIIEAEEPEEIKAGDDANSFIWLNKKEIIDKIKNNEIVYHHRAYILKGLEYLDSIPKKNKDLKKCTTSKKNH